MSFKIKKLNELETLNGIDIRHGFYLEIIKENIIKEVLYIKNNEHLSHYLNNELEKYITLKVNDVDIYIPKDGGPDLPCITIYFNYKKRAIINKQTSTYIKS